MKLTADNIKKNILDYFSHFIFVYNGKNCGVDPYSNDNFCMWYGDEDTYVHSIDEVVTAPIFDGKSLSEILDDIEDVDGCGFGFGNP